MSTYNTLLPLTYLFTAGTVAASRTYTAQKAPHTLLTITMQETLRYRSQTLRNRYRTLHMVRYLGLHRQHHRIIIFYYFYLWILCILYLIKITSHRYQTMGNIFNLYCYICIYIFFCVSPSYPRPDRHTGPAPVPCPSGTLESSPREASSVYKHTKSIRICVEESTSALFPR